MSELRERDWCNIVTCHEGLNTVFTWKFEDRAKSDLSLTPPPESLREKPNSNLTSRTKSQLSSDNTDVALCCAISVCGNYTVIGYKSGDIHMYIYIY